MADLTYLSAVIFLLLQLICSCVGFNCLKEHSCKCKLDDGTVIDLSPIGSKTGEPKFKNVPDAGAGDVWSYNPCHSFTENSCSDVASCQIRNGAGFNAGTQDSAVFKFDEQNGMALVYSATTEGVLRTTYVYLQCEQNEDGALNVLGEITPDGNYYMYLSSKYACPTEDGSSAGPGSSSGLSGGSILLIIVIVFIFVYLVGGMVFQTVLRKAEGKERVPNVAFWSALPSLIKEGFQFTYKSVKQRAGYSSI